jgi:hypothetical protein
MSQSQCRIQEKQKPRRGRHTCCQIEKQVATVTECSLTVKEFDENAPYVPSLTHRRVSDWVIWRNMSKLKWNYPSLCQWHTSVLLWISKNKTMTKGVGIANWWADWRTIWYWLLDSASLGLQHRVWLVASCWSSIWQDQRERAWYVPQAVCRDWFDGIYGVWSAYYRSMDRPAHGQWTPLVSWYVLWDNWTP